MSISQSHCIVVCDLYLRTVRLMVRKFRRKSKTLFVKPSLHFHSLQIQIPRKSSIQIWWVAFLPVGPRIKHLCLKIVWEKRTRQQNKSWLKGIRRRVVQSHVCHFLFFWGLTLDKWSNFRFVIRKINSLNQTKCKEKLNLWASITV